MKTLKPLFFILSLALVFGVSSCKDDKKEKLNPENNASLKFVIMDGNEEMALNDTAILSTGFEFKLQLLRLYVSDITLIETDGTEYLVKDVDILSPVKGDDNTTTFTAPYNDYKSIRIGYGLNAEQNLSDPTSFSQEHPLSNYWSMYWPMINYRFLKLEGRSKQLSTNTEYLVAIHPGKDALYKVRTYDFPSTLSVSSSSSPQLAVRFDINDLFDGPGGVIDFSIEDANQVHMIDSLDDVIGQRFMTNLSAATYLD